MIRPILLLSLAAAAAAAGLAGCADEPYYGPPPPGHVRWCFAHHSGYDPNTNLFPTGDGRLRVCRVHPEGYYGPPPPLPPPPPPPPRY